MLYAPVFYAGALIGLAASSSAHLIMTQPVPYSVDTLDNSPLINAAPGTAESNFPCKLRTNAFQVSTENHIKVGESNVMSWKGSASHGGGTCQLSVTQDRAPTANSKFKVIASWIGGCPTSAAGNDGTQPFNWTLPSEVPNGKATLAWNWVSHISGQPENYMNCAPITVTGGASDTTEFDQLEDLFRVNLPSSECGSQLSSNLQIPNPGKYVTTFASTSLATPTGTGCAAMGQASATGGASGGSPNANAGSSAGSAGTTSAPAAAAPSGAGSAGSQVSLAFPTGSGAVGTTLATSAAASATGEVAAPAPAAPTGSSGASSGGTGSCSTNGAVVCNGDSQFGICNFGKVVWQGVAAGTTCQNGQISKKRSIHAHHPHGLFN